MRKLNHAYIWQFSYRFSKNGVKKKLSWQELVDMVEQATKETKKSNIINSFMYCSFHLKQNSSFVFYKNNLNDRLRTLLSFNLEQAKFIGAQFDPSDYPHSHLIDNTPTVVNTQEIFYHSNRDYRDNKINLSTSPQAH